MLLGHVSKSQHHISIWKYLYIYLKICHYIRIVWTFLYTDTRPKYIKLTVVALTPFTAHASALKQKLLEYTTCYFLTQGTIKRQFRHALWTPAAETFSQFDRRPLRFQAYITDAFAKFEVALSPAGPEEETRERLDECMRRPAGSSPTLDYISKKLQNCIFVRWSCRNTNRYSSTYSRE